MNLAYLALNLTLMTCCYVPSQGFNITEIGYSQVHYDKMYEKNNLCLCDTPKGSPCPCELPLGVDSMNCGDAVCSVNTKFSFATLQQNISQQQQPYLPELQSSQACNSCNVNNNNNCGVPIASSTCGCNCACSNCACGKPVKKVIKQPTAPTTQYYSGYGRRWRIFKGRVFDGSGLFNRSGCSSCR